MNGQDFTRIIQRAFVPFMESLHFVALPTQISGRLYQAKFVGEEFTLSVGFEPGDNYFSIMLLTNEDGDLASIDDRNKTPGLKDLNKLYMPLTEISERELNESFFAGIDVNNVFERQLLKSAKDLRLVLPKHLAHFRKG